jgi:hypothetical protein
MTTPEARVKAKLRKLLGKYTGIYTYWPVPFGYGRTTLDVLGCYRGRFFSVETKAEGKKPTLRQMGELEHIAEAMGKSFVITGTDSPVFEDLRCWLDELTLTVPYAPHLPSDPVRRRAI